MMTSNILIAVDLFLTRERTFFIKHIGKQGRLLAETDLYLISVERSKKKKSTSKSVGANFDHTTDKPDDWLSILSFYQDLCRIVPVFSSNYALQYEFN